MKTDNLTYVDILQGILNGEIDSFVIVAKVVDTDEEPHTVRICKMNEIRRQDILCILDNLVTMADVITSKLQEQDAEEKDS